jgi:hypothetical protein
LRFSIINSKNRRRHSETITHPHYGSAVIRGQKPIVIVARLEKCLQGATREEWLRLLKRFFSGSIVCARTELIGSEST